MADVTRAPKVRIAAAEDAHAVDDGGTEGARPSEASSDATARDAAAKDGAAGGDATTQAGRVTLAAWLSRSVPGHEHAVIGAACGLVVALLIFVIGLLRTLLVVVLVGGGAAIGQAFDGDPRIIAIIRKIVSERRS